MDEIIAIDQDEYIRVVKIGNSYHLEEKKGILFFSSSWEFKERTEQTWIVSKWIENYDLLTDDAFFQDPDKTGYYHVYTTNDGIKLYAKEKVTICNCNDSLHEQGIGCL